MMTDTRFTPGPWEWINSETDEPFDFESEWDGLGYPSLRTTWARPDTDYDLPVFILNAEPDYLMDHTADAHLIAAAPDLYAALDAAVKQLEAHGFDGLSCGGYDALAKARGEA